MFKTNPLITSRNYLFQHQSVELHYPTMLNTVLLVMKWYRWFQKIQLVPCPCFSGPTLLYPSCAFKSEVMRSSNSVHNIKFIRIYNIVMWDWQYHVDIFPDIPHSLIECGNIHKSSTEYCHSHITLLWIWLMLWEYSKGSYKREQWESVCYSSPTEHHD